MTKIRDGILVSPNNAIVEVSRLQYALHNGDAFIGSHLFTGVANSNFADMRITTGDKVPFLIPVIASDGRAQVYLYEGTTFSSAGTNVTLYNRDRDSSKTSDVSIEQSPTINSLGTKIGSALISGSGQGVTKVGSSGGRTIEWHLKNNAEYLLRVENVSGSSSSVLTEIDIWHP